MLQNDLTLVRWYSFVCFYLEYQLLYYALNRLICKGLFFVYCTIIGTIVYSGHVIEIGQNVTKIINQYKMKMKIQIQQHRFQSLSLSSFITNNIPLHHTRTFYFQLHEHNRVIYLVTCGVRELFGWVMFVFFLVHIPVNISLIRQNIFIQNSKVIELLVLWLIVFLQIFVAGVLFCPLAYSCKVFHSPKKFIPSFQLLTTTAPTIMDGNIQMNNGWIFYKMKYDDLYQRLLYGPKFAISIGPVKEITYFSSLEVFKYFNM